MVWPFSEMETKMKIRMQSALLSAAIASGAMLGVASVHAQANKYPSKPVKLVVGYAPGGATDSSARMMA